MNLKRQLRRVKYRLDSDWLRNPASRRKLARQAPVLDETQREILRGLETDGIALTSIDALPGLEPGWQRLQARSRAFETGDTVARSRADYRRDPARGRKSYLVKMLPERARLEADDALLEIGLDARILDTVNSYLGMWSRLIYTDLWYNIPLAGDHAPVASQRWHRDPEDRHLVKVFLYCNDVGAGSGPFQYVRGSAHGPYADRWPNADELSASYPPDGAVEAEIPAADRLACTGPAGTLIFCDTHGLHRGGMATEQPRVLATWVFVPPGSLFDRRYEITDPGDLGAGAQTPAAFAVAG